MISNNTPKKKSIIAEHKVLSTNSTSSVGFFFCLFLFLIG